MFLSFNDLLFRGIVLIADIFVVAVAAVSLFWGFYL